MLRANGENQIALRLDQFACERRKTPIRTIRAWAQAMRGAVAASANSARADPTSRRRVGVIW